MNSLDIIGNKKTLKYCYFRKCLFIQKEKNYGNRIQTFRKAWRPCQ